MNVPSGEPIFGEPFWLAYQQEQNQEARFKALRDMINSHAINFPDWVLPVSGPSDNKLDRFIHMLRERIAFYVRMNLSLEVLEVLEGLDLTHTVDHLAKTLVLELKSEIEAGVRKPVNPLVLCVGMKVHWWPQELTRDTKIYEIIAGPRLDEGITQWLVRSQAEWTVQYQDWADEDELYQLLENTAPLVIPPKPKKIDPTLPEID